MFTHLVGYWAKSEIPGYTITGIAEIETDGQRHPSWAQCYKAIPGYIKGESLGWKQAIQANQLGREQGKASAEYFEVSDKGAAQAALDAIDGTPEDYNMVVPDITDGEWVGDMTSRTLFQQLCGYLDGEGEGEGEVEAILWDRYRDGWRTGYEAEVVAVASRVLEGLIALSGPPIEED